MCSALGSPFLSEIFFVKAKRWEQVDGHVSCSAVKGKLV